MEFGNKKGMIIILKQIKYGETTLEITNMVADNIDSDAIIITFAESITFDEVRAVFDLADTSALRKMEYLQDGIVQGVHMGYTIVRAISLIEGAISVKFQLENPLLTEIELLKADDIAAQQYITDLELVTIEQGQQITDLELMILDLGKGEMLNV